MLHAGPWLELRRPASHGFRPGFQAAEVHFLARALQGKHAESGMQMVTAKLDSRKAYDTLAWGSIQATFVRRKLPVPLQHAYWRMHKGRRLTFRMADGSTSFEVEPTQGIPQGSPESPMVYVALLEVLFEDAESQLRAHGRPSGLNLSTANTQMEVEAQKNPTKYREDSMACVNFADDTHLLARHVRMLEYELAVVQGVFRKAGQRLNIGKCEVLVEEGPMEHARPRRWSDAELDHYIRHGELPAPVTAALGDATYMKPVLHMTVLGSDISGDSTAIHSPSAAEGGMAQMVPDTRAVAGQIRFSARTDWPPGSNRPACAVVGA